MITIKPFLKLSLLFFIVCLLSNCKKIEDATVDTSFQSIYPAVAGNGDYVTIIGKNLVPDGQTPVVTINGKQVTVVKQGSDSIKVIIPKLIGSGKVTVTIGGHTYNGPNFTYKYKATVTTLAGSGDVGTADGPLRSASFNCPWGITGDTNGDLYIADVYNGVVRKISMADSTVSTIRIDQPDFYSPYNITMDKSHNLYLTDFNKHLAKVTPAGVATSIYTGDMVSTGIAVGPDGNLYVSDNNNFNITKFTTAGQRLSTLTTNIITPRNIIFDSEDNMYVAAYDGAKSAAAIYQVNSAGVAKEVVADKDFGGWEIALDKYGNFYEADHFHNLIRLIEPNGNIITVAGSGAAADVDGIGINASFNGPAGLTIGADGALYVSTYNYDTKAGNKIRKIVIE